MNDADRLRRYRRELREAGVTRKRVDASEARAWLTALSEQGYGLRSLSRLSGVQRSVLQDVRSGKQTRISRKTEARILEMFPSDARRPALGTARRIQALMREGHTLAELASETGVSQSTLGHVAHGRHKRVRPETYEGVREAYSRLAGQPRLDPTGRRASGMAKRNGWRSSIAWDNPDTDPDYVQEVPQRQKRWEVIWREYQWLRQSGTSPALIAESLGMREDSMHDALKRYAKLHGLEYHAGA